MDWMWTVIPVILILGMAENRPVPEGPIHLLVAVKNIRQSNQRMANLARMFDSVLRHAVRRPLHWIFLIQRQDVPITEVLVRRIIASKAQVPIQIEYVDLDLVVAKFQTQINMTRQYFLNTQPLNSSRYYDEVFHIGLVYHLIFPFRRLIALDLDLKFMVDIAELAEQFERMTPENILCVANDLAPHYWYDFRHFRQRHPGTAVGQVRPGLQGFNTGVLLLDLERMRKSELYRLYLFNEELVRGLCEKYEFNGTLAYQDLFTLLGAEHPQLIHTLDCTWNRQLDDTALADEKFTAIFEPFHRCDGAIRIYHANGGSVMVDDPEGSLAVLLNSTTSFSN